MGHSDAAAAQGGGVAPANSRIWRAAPNAPRRIILAGSSQSAMCREPDHSPISRRVRLPSSLAQLAPFRAQLRSLLRELCLPEASVHDIVLATHEAVVNAIVHGNAGETERYVEIEVATGGHTLTVQVADEGRGFDWPAWLRRAQERATPPEALTGRGILVMAAVMDDVQFSECGNVVRLTKRLEGRTSRPKA